MAKDGKDKPSCDDLKYLNALLTPGELEQLETFAQDFCLTDVVLDLWNYPDGLNNSKGSCSLWLTNPAAGTSEILFKLYVDKHGRQVHLTSGIFCPAGSYISASSAVFVEGGTASLRLLLSGFFC